MALAGGARIFALLDEKPEVNEGDITLVHAKYEADDTVTETNESTGMWAWKRMDADGKPRYTKLEGDIVFKDVDFGYDEAKSSCTTSTSTAVRARRSLSSVLPAPVRPPSPT